MFTVGQYVHVLNVLGEPDRDIKANVGRILRIEGEGPLAIITVRMVTFPRTYRLPVNVFAPVKDLRTIIKAAALQQVKPGDRIELIAMHPSEPAPVEPGTRGTVTFVNEIQIGVDWDNGRKLMLAVPEDEFIGVED
jgi:hypothetical protein